MLLPLRDVYMYVYIYMHVCVKAVHVYRVYRRRKLLAEVVLIFAVVANTSVGSYKPMKKEIKQ